MDEYKIEIQAKVENDETYAAVGFNVGSGMGPALVIGCHSEVSFYWNTASYSNLKLDSNGITNGTVQIKDGLIKCSFILDAKLDITDPTNASNTFDLDLNKKAYHILLAKGKANDDGTLNQHSIGNNNRKNSTEAFELSEYNKYLDTFYSDCGGKQGCFGLPGGCIDSRSCSILVTFAQVPESGDVDFGLLLTGSSDNSYVAMALSSDNQMGDDSVTFCYKPGQDISEAGVAMAWNYDDPKTSKMLNETQLGLLNIKTEMVDGRLSCKFQRRMQTYIDIPDTNKSEVFDLKEKYFLLLASGELQEDSESPIGYNLLYHDTRGSSDGKVDFSEYIIISEREPIYITVIFLLNLVQNQSNSEKQL